MAKSLYSLPLALRRHRLRARADSQLVRFYEHGQIVKTHPRKAPGQRSIDKADLPEEALAAGQRDVDFFVRKAEHGQHVGLFAEALAAKPLPWRRLRELFKLLGLARKYGARLDARCKTELDANMVDVYLSPTSFASTRASSRRLHTRRAFGRSVAARRAGRRDPRPARSTSRSAAFTARPHHKSYGKIPSR